MSEPKLLEKPEPVLIQYYNVIFCLYLVTETDKENFRMFSTVVQSNELFMRDIVKWCDGHGIKYRTTFHYIIGYPFKLNLWNLYTYIRFSISRKFGRE